MVIVQPNCRVRTFSSKEWRNPNGGSRSFSSPSSLLRLRRGYADTGLFGRELRYERTACVHEAPTDRTWFLIRRAPMRCTISRVMLTRTIGFRPARASRRIFHTDQICRRFERRSSLFAVRSGNTRCAQYLRPAHRSSHSLTACFACFLHAACFAAWTTTRHTNPVLTITRCWCAPRAAHGTCELFGRMCLCSSEPFGRVILLVVAARARPHLRFRKILKAHSVLRACLLDALARRI